MQAAHPELQVTGEIARLVGTAIAQQRMPRYVAVEGPIGVGKTTLARRLAASFGYPVLLEPAAENPFLDRFYIEQGRHALPTQLFFLLHRAKLVGEIPADDLVGPSLVADFLMEKDRLFAQMTLDKAEFDLYQQIYASLQLQPPKPDLVVYLQAPAEILYHRVIERGIDSERHIELDYLRALADKYAEFFHYYSNAPLLIVNASEIDLANNEVHFEALLGQLLNMDGARQFFNPNPTLL